MATVPTSWNPSNCHGTWPPAPRPGQTEALRPAFGQQERPRNTEEGTERFKPQGTEPEPRRDQWTSRWPWKCLERGDEAVGRLLSASGDWPCPASPHGPEVPIWPAELSARAPSSSSQQHPGRDPRPFVNYPQAPDQSPRLTAHCSGSPGQYPRAPAHCPQPSSQYPRTPAQCSGSPGHYPRPSSNQQSPTQC